MRSIIELLIDARDYARRASEYVKDGGYSAFAADRLRQDAVCFCLVVAGEACGQAAKQMLNAPTRNSLGRDKGDEKHSGSRV
jgi:uncharacterized protein with HEPN domain